MINAKSFLLAGVAGLATLTAAQAADLPVKAKPVEYVKVCSLYGVGFYYIPGTQTCIRIGGYVRAQAEYNSSDNGRVFGSTHSAAGGTGNPGILGGLDNRLSNDLNFTSRGSVSFDVRNQTEYGALRTFVRFYMQFQSVGTATIPFLDRGFIQFAGFTFGRSQSNFDIFSNTERYSYFDSKTSGDTYNSAVDMVAYTLNFGNGLTGTLAAETPSNHYPAGVIDGTQASFAVNAVTTLDTAGFRMPDIVANLRLDQSWGYVGVSGAVHSVAGAYFLTPNIEINGAPDTRYGWAVSAGGLAYLSSATSIGASFAWTKGAVGYATKAGSWQMYDGDSVGVGWLVDGIFDTTNPAVAGGGRDIQLTNAWSANAALEHLWTPQWRTSLYGGYTKIWYGDVATNIINIHLPGAAGTRPCVVPVSGAVWPPVNIPAGGAGNSCSPDFSFYQVGSRTQWNPVPTLSLGVDVAYTHLNTAYQGTAPGLYAANGTKTARNTLDDQGIFSAIFRVQNNF